MIRAAEYSDLGQILSLCKDIHNQQQCDEIGYEYDAQQVTREFFDAMVDGKQKIYVYDESMIWGILWLEITSFKFNKNNKRLVEQLWHARSDLRKREKVKILKELINKMEEFADERNIKVRVVSEPRMFNTKNFLKSLGYKPHENVFVKVR